jgi:outer membrane protein assembly factor BamB
MRPTRLTRRFLNLFVLGALAFFAPGVRADDWPQWMGPKRDGVWRETGILDKFPKGGLKAKWRTPIGGGYAGPAVVGNRVYVTDRVLAKGAKDPANPFQPTNSRGKERVLCIDADSGKLVWKHEYDCTYEMSYPCGPRTTPVVHGGKVYTLGAMGDLCCVDAATGKPVWSKNFMKVYDAPMPTWGFSSNPLLDGDKVICLVGGEGSVVVAFDKDTGKEKWKALSLNSSELGYCPPVIVNAAGKRQLIVWHPESVNSLDPETGKLYWSHPFKVGANMTIPTPRLHGDKLYLTCFYTGSLMLKLSADKDGTPTATELWRSKSRGERPKQTDKLHAVMCTPVLEGDYIYGVCSYGQLRCLRVADGKREWEEMTATGNYKEPERWANAFIVPQGKRYFLFNEKGDLIIATMTPKAYKELDRAHVLDPTGQLAAGFSSPRKIVWSHPAFANRSMYARNDKEIVCVSLAAESK